MENILAQIRTLPPLPEVVCELTKLIDNPKSTAEDLAKVISKDQSLTARVLRLVNSSYYAFRSKISKVSHAISLMGFTAIKNIVLGLSLIDTFRKKESDDGLNHEMFWEHSLGAATAAKAIGEKAGYISPEEAFVAGLIHDIGKVIFDMAAPKEYEYVLKVAAEKHRTIHSVEEEFIGYSHGELGCELARTWNLPEKLRTAIRNHHDDEPQEQLTKIVLAADTLTKAASVGFGGDVIVSHLPDTVSRSLDISRGNFSRIFSGFKNEVEKTRIFLGMDERPDEQHEIEDRHNLNIDAPPIIIADEKPRLINIPQLILEEENFLVKLSGIPIRMTRDEKREAGLILIDTEKQDYPPDIEVRTGEGASRRIPVKTIHSPFEPRKLIDLVNSQLTRQPAYHRTFR